jgi:hypothetical protein
MEDSDGDGLYDSRDPKPLQHCGNLFDFADDINYRPINEEVYDSQAISDSTYDKKPSDGSEAEIRLRAYLTAYPGIFPTPNSAKALRHFLENTGTLYSISLSDMLSEFPEAEERMLKNFDLLLEACEHMVMDGETITLATNSAFHKHKDIYATRSLNGRFLSSTFDWNYTLGNSRAAIVGTVTRSEDSYFLMVNYFLDDFYHWKEGSDAKGGLVTDGEMFILHNRGFAKQFRVEGSFKGQFISWNEGQRFELGDRFLQTMPLLY